MAGLNVQYGGLTVRDGGAMITNEFGGSNVLTLTAADASNFAYDILKLVGKR